MPGFFDNGSEQLPPSILRTPTEQHSILLQLLQQSTPLTLTFQGRNQQFLTYLASTDPDSNKLALDALTPEEGQRLLQRGDPFRIDAYLNGVHVHWTANSTPSIGTLEGHTVAWFELPTELSHHQKRSVFRARTLQDEPVTLRLAGSSLEQPLSNIPVLDLSATGCKARVEHAGHCPLQTGQVLDHSCLILPSGEISLAVEIRYIQHREEQNWSILGLKFLHTDGMAQRSIERYVNHLQRESRRRQEGSLF